MSTHIVIDELEGLYVLQGEGIRQEKKYINISDLEELFKKEIDFTTGILPTGTKYYSSSNNRTTIIIEKAPQKWEIKYHARRSDRVTTHVVPLPYLLFGFTIADRQISRSNMAVSKVPLNPSSNIQLYKLPLGNIYDDTHICWGRQQLPNIANPFQLSGIPDLFFQCPFNGDLSDHAFIGYDSDNNNLTHIIDRLSQLDTFPLDILNQNRDFNYFKRYLERRD